MFMAGDLVKCIQPISNVDAHFNLSDKEVYEVEYCDDHCIKLSGIIFKFSKKRFILANEFIEDTGADFF